MRPAYGLAHLLVEVREVPVADAGVDDTVERHEQLALIVPSEPPVM